MGIKVDASHSFWRARAIRRLTEESRRGEKGEGRNGRKVGRG